MSDATDELDFWGRQLLRRSRSNPFRSKMREFVEETSPPVDPKEVRRRNRDGTDLSELVDAGRDERV